MKKIIVIAVIAMGTSFALSSCSGSSAKNEVPSSITDSSTIYSCTMHQEVISDHPGECPKCGMTLVKQKITPMQKKLFDEGKYVTVKN
jgi:Cu(I)/Ag(I) efflux system membrane fusion protein